MKQKLSFTETLKKVQKIQFRCLGTNVSFQVQVRRFEDGDTGILVMINKVESDDFPMFSLYSFDTEKARMAFMNGIEKTLKEYGV